MKLAVSSDERTQLTSTVIEDLKKRGHTLTLFGPISEEENRDADTDWTLTEWRAVLDALEVALEHADVPAIRPRIEHAQIMDPRDIARLGKTGGMPGYPAGVKNSH